MTRIIACIAVALLVVTAVRVFDHDGPVPHAGSALGATGSDGGPTGQCGAVATPSCTPDIGGRGTVSVEGLTWQVERLSTARVLGQTSFATGIRARGTYVIATVRVRSARRRSVTLSDAVVELVGARTYHLDAGATSLNAGEADDVIDGARIGPGEQLETSVVFDVPSREVTKKIGLRFNAAVSDSVYAVIRPLGRYVAPVADRRTTTADEAGGW